MIKAQLTKLAKAGFFSIFFSNIFIKIITFASGIFIIRFLSKYEYGLYSSANNIISMFLLFDGLGTISAILQFCSENYDDKSKYNAYANMGLKIGFLFNIFVSIILLLLGFFYKFPIKGINNIIIIMSFVPMLTYLTNYFTIICRTKLEETRYSILNILSAIIMFIGSIIGALVAQLYGLVVSRVLGPILFLFISYFIVKRILPKKDEILTLTSTEKKNFLSISITSSVTNAIGQLMYIIDVFVIGIMIPNALIIASYKTATVIPFALDFIPSTIMIFVYPYFARNNKNREWVKKTYAKLIIYSTLINGIIAAGVFVFAPFIIKIVFGETYMDVLIPFRILTVNFFIAGSFRVTASNVLISLKKIYFNLIVSLFSGALNIVLNIVFILLWGSTGAAICTLMIVFISAIIYNIYIVYLFFRKGKKDRKNTTTFEIAEDRNE